MTAKFLVVEIDDNAAAVDLVQIMLDRGFGRLMLLDDLGKHPALSMRQKRRNGSSSPSTPSDSATCSESSRDRQKGLKIMQLADALFKEEAAAREANSVAEASDLLDLLTSAAPEIISVGSIKEEAQDSLNDTFADNEDTTFGSFDFSSNQSQLDFLAQARCLVPDASCSSGPAAKRARTENDPDKDYHQCQLCGTRVKAPRGGRWNLQMHVMAMHSALRPYKCQKCDFQDYRKPGMRKHCILSHGHDMEPVDISSEEKRIEWDAVMGRCFPEFAYRTGFLAETKPTSSGALAVE
ncbi:unnamed protein product [Caenorhabditis auriculariae]|uniref:C2H2-type domain-containing protein n=1 Tax=Caenorhabditis auriculariae TaxID=2777116 RepID=A0A8S1H8T9_9PELO|nr:unnamed protein product [Caenorhabditis auriculariae]